MAVNEGKYVSGNGKSNKGLIGAYVLSGVTLLALVFNSVYDSGRSKSQKESLEDARLTKIVFESKFNRLDRKIDDPVPNDTLPATVLSYARIDEFNNLVGKVNSLSGSVNQNTADLETHIGVFDQYSIDNRETQKNLRDNILKNKDNLTLTQEVAADGFEKVRRRIDEVSGLVALENYRFKHDVAKKADSLRNVYESLAPGFFIFGRKGFDLNNFSKEFKLSDFGTKTMDNLLRNMPKVSELADSAAYWELDGRDFNRETLVNDLGVLLFFQGAEEKYTFRGTKGKTHLEYMGDHSAFSEWFGDLSTQYETIKSRLE